MKQLPSGASGKTGGRRRLAAVVSAACAVVVCALFFFSGDAPLQKTPGISGTEGGGTAVSVDPGDLLLRSKAVLANFELVGVADTGGVYPPEFEEYGLAAKGRDREEVLAEAVRDLTLVVEQVPESAEAHHLLGSAYFLQGKAEAGAEAYARALSRDPSNPNTHVGYIILLSESGRIRDAETALAGFERLFPVELESSLTLFASVNLYAGRYRQAGSAASDLLELDPNDTWARQVLALSLDGLGRASTADGEWARLMEAEPSRRTEFEALRREWAQRRKN